MLSWRCDFSLHAPIKSHLSVSHLRCPHKMLACGDLFLLQEMKRNPPAPVNLAGGLVCADPLLIQGHRFKFKVTNYTDKSI